jgi:hypothetical protein
MDSKVRSIVALFLLAAAANATSTNAVGIVLWFNCKAIVPYVNTADANFTLSQYEDTLARLSVKLIVHREGVSLILINGQEIKKLNVSDPGAVEKIKQICLVATKELNKHLNKTEDAVYRQLNASKSIEEVANNTERGLQTLMRVRNLLIFVNTSSRAIWIE